MLVPDATDIAKLKKKADKAKEELRHARACKQLGLPSALKVPTKSQLKVRRKKLAKALPKETRQGILDGVHGKTEECKTVGDIMQKYSVTHEEFLGVIELNTRVVKYEVLNEETL